MANEIHFSEICAFAADAIRDASADEIIASAEISGSTVNLSKRLFRRYHSAERYAERNGYVGVGVISFAAYRVGAFVERCKRNQVAAFNLYAFANRVGESK